jgi:hypothetical protein
MVAQQCSGELDDRQILIRYAVGSAFADRRDRGFGHILTPCTAGLRAPDVFSLELPRDGHRGEHADPKVQGTLEPHVGAEVRDPASQFGAVQEHRKRGL